MSFIVVLSLVVVGLAVAGVVFGLMPRRQGVQSDLKSVQPGPSVVRVLRSEEEFTEALRRAAARERDLADAMLDRANRYEALLGHHQPAVHLAEARTVPTAQQVPGRSSQSA